MIKHGYNNNLQNNKNQCHKRKKKSSRKKVVNNNVAHNHQYKHQIEDTAQIMHYFDLIFMFVQFQCY